MHEAFTFLSLGAAAALFALAAVTVWWMLRAWHDEGSTAHAAHSTHEVAPSLPPGSLSFSLVAPARHEEVVFGATLDRLAVLDHPDYEVIAVVGDDDEATAAVARAAAERHPDVIRVVVDSSVPKSKPKALNTALPHCRGDVLGIFDAEDVVHPRLLTVVEERFLTEAPAAVQAGVQLMNFWSTWFSAHNTLEYYFWFRSRLRRQAELGFIPLGGNTVFVRRRLLELLGGWDGECLAEDCDLGVRLSSHGMPVAVVYDPDVVTREEAPVQLGEFIRQRTRWNQGFLQVLAKGDWQLLPGRTQRALALFTLGTPFVQAFTGALAPLALVGMVLGRTGEGVALLTFAPLVPVAMAIVVNCVGLADLGQIAGRRPRCLDYARVILGTPAFQLLLAFAAIRAVVRHRRGIALWEKTAHTGLHLIGEADERRPAATAGAMVTTRTGAGSAHARATTEEAARA